MRYYDTNISERLDINNSDLTKQAQGKDWRNKLSVADKDPELLEELNRIISDSSIPDGPDDKMSDDKEDQLVYLLFTIKKLCPAMHMLKWS